MKDVIIVGGGISGATLAWQWHLEGKSVHWIGDGKASSSHVAAGVFNPVVLKRFSPVWKSEEQLNHLFPFYAQVENYLDSILIHLVPIWRRFHDDNERTTWIRKSGREDLKNLMQMQPVDDSIHGIEAANGFGLVRHTGWLDTLAYINQSINYFQNREEFETGSFDYDRLKITSDKITYDSIEAKNILFAEGVHIHQNPWFNDLPMQGNKGEVLIIKCPGLELKQIVKSSVFLMPYQGDLFWVGATYDRDFESEAPSAQAKIFLRDKLETFLTLPYEIIAHKSGIRPTTMDRRPFIGCHPYEKNVYVFNGMGSRASLVAPWAARYLFNAMYKGEPLPEEMDIARFRD